MTASELKYQVEQAGHEPHFFTRSTMKFFGDTMRNYGVRKAEIRTMYDSNGEYAGENGVSVSVWELYRRNPVKHNLFGSAYFSADTFRLVYPVR
jgi:hypothetical protein